MTMIDNFLQEYKVRAVNYLIGLRTELPKIEKELKAKGERYPIQRMIEMVGDQNFRTYEYKWTNEQIEKFIDEDVKIKKETLMKKIEAKAGNIIDARHLEIFEDGHLKGIIEGDKATVSIKTIYAGGHNIQRLHYRTLIKELKK